MLNIKDYPQRLVLAASLILVLTALLVPNNTSLDLHLHDTYFIIALSHILLLLSIITIFIWIIYLLTFRLLYSKILTWIHVIVTITSLLTLTSVLLVGNDPAPQPRRYFDYSTWNSPELYPTSVKVMALLIVLFLAAQFFFIINLVAGLGKRMVNF